MSKTKGFLLAVAVAAMGFTFSCSSDDDDGGGKDNPSPPSDGRGDQSSPSGGGDNQSSPSGGDNQSSSSGGVGNTCSADFRTVVIGTQTWMAENLNCDVVGNFGSHVKCYNDDPANCTKYGRLYEWGDAMKACPSGWHLPSDAEWTTLKNYAGSSTAGTKLKATSGWNDVNGVSGNGRDEYGVSALPGGYYGTGRFYDVGTVGRWWSATQTSYDMAYYWNMGYLGGMGGSQNSNTSYLYSVRCVQD